MPDKTDTITIIGKVHVEGLKAKDTLVAQTLQLDKSPSTFADNPYVKTFLPAAVSLIVALGVFALGQYFTNKNKQKDQKTLLEGSKEALVEWLTAMEQPMFLLYGYFTDFIKAAKLEKRLDVVGLTSIHTLFDKVMEIKLTDYWVYTVLNLEGDINKNTLRSYYILQHVRWLQTAEKNAIEIHTNYQNKINELISSYNEAMDLYTVLNVEMLQEVQSEPNHPAKIFSDNIFSFVTQQGIDNMDEWFQNFLHPIHQIIYKELNENRANIFAPKFLRIMVKLRLVYLNWQRLMNSLISDFEQIAKDYSQTIKDLREETQLLRNTKIKDAKDIKMALK